MILHVTEDVRRVLTTMLSTALKLPHDAHVVVHLPGNPWGDLDAFRAQVHGPLHGRADPDPTTPRASAVPIAAQDVAPVRDVLDGLAESITGGSDWRVPDEGKAEALIRVLRSLREVETSAAPTRVPADALVALVALVERSSVVLRAPLLDLLREDPQHAPAGRRTPAPELLDVHRRRLARWEALGVPRSRGFPAFVAALERAADAEVVLTRVTTANRTAILLLSADLAELLACLLIEGGLRPAPVSELFTEHDAVAQVCITDRPAGLVQGARVFARFDAEEVDVEIVPLQWSIPASACREAEVRFVHDAPRREVRAGLRFSLHEDGREIGFGSVLETPGDPFGRLWRSFYEAVDALTASLTAEAARVAVARSANASFPLRALAAYHAADDPEDERVVVSLDVQAEVVEVDLDVVGDPAPMDDDVLRLDLADPRLHEALRAFVVRARPHVDAALRRG